ncbi:hypothetical protein ACH4VR_10420 [Streptomyces sp. NPDC020883]|uniref:hypothetical protein n=1 Tax=Streptomyces sp. NPDC020883 TaxID=3365099 RepID=UPI0037A54C53
MDAAENDQGNGHSDQPDRSGAPLLDLDPDLDSEGLDSGDLGSEREDGRMGLTPRQARRVRVVLASVMMALVAVLLVVRLATRGSVLVVGVYGAALILCGIVIELSRHGRTRLGTWLLGVGLAAAIVSDWLLLP